MEDKNNNQGLPGQAPQQPSQQKQNQNQYEAEKTYWESGIVEQPEVSAQEPSVPETATQFYQFYQQQMKGSSYAEQPSQVIKSEVPKKKSNGKLLAAIIVVLLLLSIGATAYAFQSTLINTVALMTKSPAQYYAFIEKKAFDNSVDGIMPYLNSDRKNIAFNTSVDITYDHDTVNSLLRNTTGMNLEDYENELGFSLDRIGIDVLVAMQDGLQYNSLGLSLNQIDIFSLEFLINSIKQELLVRIPELSSAYLKQSLATDDYDINTKAKLLETLIKYEGSADFLKRYGHIIADHMNNVELSKNVELKVDTLSVTCNKLTVTFDNESMNAIISAVLEELKDDEFIQDLLTINNITKEQFLTSLKNAEANLQEELSRSVVIQNSIVMHVFVNNQGDIIGREIDAIKADSSLGSLGYISLNEKDFNEFELYIKDETGKTIVKSVGNRRKDGEAYGGSATLEISNVPSMLSSNISIDIVYEDIRTVAKDNRIYHYGTYTISSLSLMGMQIIVENDVIDDVQNSKLVFQMGVSPLVTINSSTKFLEDYYPSFSEDGELYTEYESYLSSIDINAFIINLANKLGVDLK